MDSQVHDSDLNRSLRGFLGDKVMPGSVQECRQLCEQASPIARIQVDSPPFFVFHSVRSNYLVNHITDYLQWVYTTRGK